MKTCSTCQRDLSLSEFGVDKSKSDGLNIYCKPCARDKVIARRAAVKAGVLRPMRKPSIISPRNMRLWLERTTDTTAKVLKAVENGARSQRQICDFTGLTFDEVGDALTILVLESRRVRIEPAPRNEIESWQGENWKYSAAA